MKSEHDPNQARANADSKVVGERRLAESLVTVELLKLVDRCLTGHQGAVREFIALYQGPVFGLCYRMLSQRQDAEDMAQETFVRAIRSLHQWDRTRDIIPWILSIAANRCRSLLVVRKKHPINGVAIEIASGDESCDDAAKNLGEELRLALDRLRPEYAQAFVLFYEQELCYAEISKIMDCPLGTVKTWIHRARKEIIEQLKRREVFTQSNHS